mgnify:CR=1 FL=1
MAKRFTDSDKHKDPWFRKLRADLKMLFLFICDDCNHAGVWKENVQLFNVIYGQSVSVDDLVLLEEKLTKIDDETYFLTSFIKFQYGSLRTTNKAHVGVIRALNYAGISYLQYLEPKPLASPQGIGEGEGEGIGIGIGVGVSEEKGTKGKAKYTTKDIPF